MSLDTTIAGVSANSYISVVEANAYASARVGREAAQWLEVTLPVTKETALKQATGDVDSYVRAGARYDADQALVFPRQTDLSGLAPFIPPNVRKATFEQAIYLLANASLMSDAASRRARGLFSFSEDNLGGSVAIDPEFGLMAPDAVKLLRAVVVTRSGFSGSVQLKTVVSEAWDSPRDWTNW